MAFAIAFGRADILKLLLTIREYDNRTRKFVDPSKLSKTTTTTTTTNNNNKKKKNRTDSNHNDSSNVDEGKWILEHRLNKGVALDKHIFLEENSIDKKYAVEHRQSNKLVYKNLLEVALDDQYETNIPYEQKLVMVKMILTLTKGIKWINEPIERNISLDEPEAAKTPLVWATIDAVREGDFRLLELLVQHGPQHGLDINREANVNFLESQHKYRAFDIALDELTYPTSKYKKKLNPTTRTKESQRLDIYDEKGRKKVRQNAKKVMYYFLDNAKRLGLDLDDCMLRKINQSNLILPIYGWQQSQLSSHSTGWSNAQQHFEKTYPDLWAQFQKIHAQQERKPPLIQKYNPSEIGRSALLKVAGLRIKMQIAVGDEVVFVPNEKTIETTDPISGHTYVRTVAEIFNPINQVRLVFFQTSFFLCFVNEFFCRFQI